MPYRISRLGYVEVRSLDLDRDLEHYVDVLGLHLSGREGRSAYLKGWDERHAYSVCLTQADRPGMVRMAFRTVDPEDLDYYEHRLKELAVAYEVIPEDYRRGRALRFPVPSGHTVELYNEMDYTGNLLPSVNPAPWPDGLKGVAPPRLDHTLVTAPEPHKAIQFFQEVLEFRVSELLIGADGVPLAAWLWQRPAPHDLAIVPGRPGGFHHAAFAVDSADALFRAADILARNKVRIDYGPGRHGITRGTTIYFFDPSGNRLETFGGYTAYQIDPDCRAIKWTQDQIGPAIFYYSMELNQTFLSVYVDGSETRGRCDSPLGHEEIRMREIFGVDPRWGVTVVRISMGLIFAVHGYQKFAGGITGVSTFFAKVSIPLPGLMAPLIAVLELVGGILLLAGLATRWVGLLFALEMIVTTFWVQIPGRGWNASDLDRSLLAAGILLFLAGAGRLAVDERWFEKGT